MPRSRPFLFQEIAEKVLKLFLKYSGSILEAISITEEMPEKSVSNSAGIPEVFRKQFRFRRKSPKSREAIPEAPSSWAPRYAWQDLVEGQSVPAGLEIRLDLSGSGRKRARIPPSWRLQVWMPTWVTERARTRTSVLVCSARAQTHTRAHTCTYTGVVSSEPMYPRPLPSRSYKSRQPSWPQSNQSAYR